MNQQAQRYAWIPNLLLRLTIGYMFASGAIGKLTDPAKFAKQFHESGILFPEVSAPIVAVLELLCGVALAFGIGTRVVATVLAVIMAGALVSTILPAQLAQTDGFWMLLSQLFYQAEWLLFGLLVWLACTGGDRASLDALRTRRRA